MAQTTNDDEFDYYAALTVTPGADEETIRQAYRRLARAYHPDIAGESGAATMKRINAAYHVLSDPARRRDYDLRHGGVATAAPFSGPSRAPHHTVPHKPAPAHTRTDGPFKLYRQFEQRDGSVAAITFARGDGVIGIGLTDGRIDLWHMAAQQRLGQLNLRASLGEAPRPGVLQELRLSPSGQHALAWGLNLGTRVWDTATQQVLWSAAVNGPSGTMDGVLLDNPSMARFALPAAPLAMAEDDPFHWAEIGRMGSDILTRPLDRAGSVSPTWAVPLHCEEPTVPRGGPNRVRVHLRALSWDGEMLVTFATGPASATITNASIVHLWNLRQYGRLGAPGPQRQGSLALPVRALWYPLAVSATATVLATQFEERAMRLYDLRTGQHLELPTGAISPDARCALSADGALLALADQHRVELWATASRQRIQVWSPGAPITALSFAGTGGMPTLALGRNDGVCEVYAAG